MRTASLLVGLLLFPLALAIHDGSIAAASPAAGEASAGAPVEGGTGVVGGISIDLGAEPDGIASSSTGEVASADWPTVTEVYTAIWCENCPADEATLRDGRDARVAAGTPGMTIMHFHREKGETQDPFGTLEGDEWWIRRYGSTSKAVTIGERQPPSVVIDGERFHAGGRAKGNGTLLDDFNASIDSGSSLDATGASSSLTWNESGGHDGDLSTNERNGSAIWETTVVPAAGGRIESHLFVIERGATLNRSGTETHYPYIVRAIHPLGEGRSGALDLALPTPHDGDDLTLVLVHEWWAIDPTDPDTVEVPEGMPAPGLALTVLATALAAVWAERRVRSDASADPRIPPRD